MDNLDKQVNAANDDKKMAIFGFVFIIITIILFNMIWQAYKNWANI